MRTDFSLNDLPLYNPWVKKLLGLEEFTSISKNEKELEREYENEKWGVLLKKITAGNIECSIETIDGIAFDKQNLNVSFYKDEFIKCTSDEIHNKFIEIIFNTISPLLPAPAIVEL